VDNVELRMRAPFSLRGRLVAEVPDGTPAPELPDTDLGLVPVAAMLADALGSFLAVRVDGGELTVRDVYPEAYQVQILTDAPVPYFLDSIRIGEQNAVGTVSILSDAMPLLVTLKLGGGTVRGTLEGCDGGPVFLVPQETSLRRSGFIRITTCDRNGHFEFAAVRPGEYYGMATGVAPRSFAALSDDHVLKQAERITVRANESTAAEIRMR
jgi:hypothetical protein